MLQKLLTVLNIGFLKTLGGKLLQNDFYCHTYVVQISRLCHILRFLGHFDLESESCPLISTMLILIQIKEAFMSIKRFNVFKVPFIQLTRKPRGLVLLHLFHFVVTLYLKVLYSFAFRNQSKEKTCR